jgi:predicted KAP-like P-loop ATPase
MGWLAKLLGRSSMDLRDKVASTPDTSNAPLVGDNPIQRVEDDMLGRAPVAASFVRQVLAIDPKQGLVVGILGPWGSGKTSFVNLALSEFKSADVTVINFNPWMFSGAQQLVEAFFLELGAQLRVSPGLAEVGEDLQQYGEAFSAMSWLPLVGPWVARGRDLAKVVGGLLQRRKEGISARRAKLQNALAELKKPIVVAVDDIDRLSTSEIRDVFKLVRLTASFPNVIYVVAFDRARVETALSEQGVPGRDYLEKILQVTLDLPVVPDSVLIAQIFSALDAALAPFENAGVLDQQMWLDVFMEIVKPLIKNMRDVRRYAAAVHGTVGALAGQIALSDVLALESIRVFLPDVFAHLHDSVGALTTASGSQPRVREEALKAQIDALMESARGHGGVVRDLIVRLFPAAQRHIENYHYGSEWKGQWLRARRVAHEDLLRLYLERVAGDSLRAFTDAEQAWAWMSDAASLDKYLRSLNPERVQDVVASLEVYEDQFAPEHVVSGATVLLNLMHNLPVRERGMFDIGGRLVVTRLVLRLLRSLKDAVAIEGAVRQIRPELKFLCAEFDLIRIVGHREGWGHKLVAEIAAADFEKQWRDRVRATPAAELARETDPLDVLFFTKRESGPEEPILEVPDAPELTLTILRAARGEVKSQSIVRRAVQRSPLLNWDALVELYGDEETLRVRIESLRAVQPTDAGDLLELSDKYLGGWRPNKLGL